MLFVLEKLVLTNGERGGFMGNEPIFTTNLTQKQIEKNFENFDVFEGLTAGLQEALQAAAEEEEKKGKALKRE